MAHRKSTWIVLALSVSLGAPFSSRAEMIQPDSQTVGPNVAPAPMVTIEAAAGASELLAANVPAFPESRDSDTSPSVAFRWRDRDRDDGPYGDHDGDGHWDRGDRGDDGDHHMRPTPLPGALTLLLCGLGFLLIIGRRTPLTRALSNLTNG